jgi:hypothetical protein
MNNKKKESCKCVVAEHAVAPCRSGECWHFGNSSRIKRVCINCGETGFQQDELQQNINRQRRESADAFNAQF